MYGMCMQIFRCRTSKEDIFLPGMMGKTTETKIGLLIQLDNNIYMQKKQM